MMSNQSNEQLAQLGLTSTSGKRKALKWGIILALLLLAGGSGVYYFGRGQNQVNIVFKTDAAIQGDLAVTVSATGSIEPTDEVEVSSELSGIITDVYVDYNDQVIKGQVLARLNTSTLEADVLVKKASLKSAQASLQQARAEAREAKAQYEHYLQVWELSGGKVPSKQDLNAYEIDWEVAQAAQLSADASVEVARANLESAQSDLSKAEIVSPIDGVVLAKDVEPGQTVASSYSAPTLFLLARDLSSMELHVDIDEADIGLIKLGQQATFTVDAYSGRSFTGQISQIRLASTEDSDTSVVSYETILTVPNPERLLLPSMTAVTDIAVESATDTLTIANAALRYQPVFGPAPGGSVSPPDKARSGNFLSNLLDGGRRGPGGRGPGGPPGENFRQNTNTTTMNGSLEGASTTVWVLRDNHPVPVHIETGISDGLRTQVISGDLQVGDLVITDSTQVQS
ncbi:efflux RND transporter periplasmic adaptor subunit [Gynuella sunshinyii]|uniref:Membrane-fusion protein n=1 Tax=Gynuella sunshinyii YC6258 TaxID=1445510 RepID=A0A0C5UYX8_9GAMM|nr:efflux RND transporter periplasmic adaptor subunit [Gynuella sunshinyii]AJQ92535.1 membrane-fusion protein [Gynuella sunshinyii YC6258]